MRRFLPLAALSLGAAAAAALFALTWVERFRFEQELEIVSNLQELARLDVESRELILAIRTGFVDSFDSLVSTDIQMVERMDSVSSQLSNPELLVTAQNELDAYRSQIERFKMSQSLRMNSLRYLPELARATASELALTGNGTAASQIAAVAAELSRGESPRESLLSELEDLRSRPIDSETPSLTAFLAHASVVAEHGSLVDGHIEKLRNHGLVSETRRLQDWYLERKIVSFSKLTNIGLSAIALSMCLLIAMSGALVALRRKAEELSETNDGLEETVRTRSSELAQAQKLESVGRLAAGVAHEINTPAQFVGDNVGFLQESFGELSGLLKQYEVIAGAAESGVVSPELVTELRAAEREADLEFLKEEIPRSLEQTAEGIGRVSKIVRAMKEFSHPGTHGKQAVDLNRAVDSTLTVASNEWKYVAEIEKDFDEELPRVPGLAAELNQVFLNIVVNGAQAIAEKQAGEPDSVEQKGTIGFRTRRDGEWALVEISDSGAGMPPEVQAHIFDPFFTTKDVGKGTGQGLAIAHSVVVDKHGGTLDVESQPGQGTTFLIRLPFVDSDET